MNYCTNCGKRLNTATKFCPYCGEPNRNIDVKPNTPIPIVYKEKSSNEYSSTHSRIDEINNQILLQNNQTSIVTKSWYAAAFFLVIIMVAFMDIISIHPSIIMISIFLMISSVVIGYMFRSREEKLQSLINGENLIAEWRLTEIQKKEYVNYLFNQEVGKNKIILLSIATIAAVVFGGFIIVIDEGKFAMFLVLIGLIIFLSLFAFGMPLYYKMKNAKGNGNILIGAKYAYINGYFHNWDFPLSGLSEAKIIQDPFYGIQLIYYYTDRTLNHSEELIIPADESIDLQNLIAHLRTYN